MEYGWRQPVDTLKFGQGLNSFDGGIDYSKAFRTVAKKGEKTDRWKF
jgi:hypothetical protein